MTLGGFLDSVLPGIDWPTYIAYGLIGLLLGNLYVYGGRLLTKATDKIMTAWAYLRAGGRIHRDHQRTFNTYQRTAIANRAAGRCEHKHPLWFRCVRPGAHADHIIPWSKGGITWIGNGAWLCARHNLRKSNRYPTPIYRWRLNRRRARYPSALTPGVTTEFTADRRDAAARRETHY